MNELALFAGAGGGILGGKLLGWRTVCAVEFDEHARNVLVARQNDGSLEPFPIWDDVRTFDGKLWRGHIDVISGGFPCQDISVAGNQKGLDGERSGLWREYARIIGEVKPRYCFIENSPQLIRLGLDRVIKDLAEMGTFQNGELSEQDMSLTPIKETESGYWPTPNCMDCLPLRSREALIKQFTTTRKGRTKPANLREAVHAACYPENLNNAELYEQAKNGGQLNPNWEEWLMGWPIGWTELSALETGKYQQWLDSHGKL